MRFQASVFHRLLEPLDRRVLNRIVSRHGGDHGVGSGPRSWTCIRHLKAMLFAQFAGLDSLREIEQALGAQPGGLYHLGLRVPRRRLHRLPPRLPIRPRNRLPNPEPTRGCRQEEPGPEAAWSALCRVAT